MPVKQGREGVRQEMREDILAYMAGFFDGEGCVNMARSARGNGCFPRVLLVNTNREILEAFRAVYGGDIKSISHRKEGWKPSWIWRLSHSRAIKFLDDIYPWLILKHEQVLTAICWDEARPGTGKRWDKESVDLLCARMAWLNRRGTRDADKIDPIIPIIQEMEVQNASY